MGLLLLCMGVLLILCFVFTIAFNVLWMFGAVIMAAMLIGSALLIGSPYPSNYHYKATVAGVIDQESSTEIYFEGYTQDGQTVTIDGYSYKNLHWLSFQNYDEFNKVLKIQIPDGTTFKYQIVNPLVPKVIN